ncbi:Glyceraldehyde-3-phosphate dehydrogenase [Plecturocebus cupreus]
MAMGLSRTSSLHLPTGTAKAMGKANPKPNRKLTGVAFHVPTANLLVMDLTCSLEKPAKCDDIKKMGIQGYNEHQIVISNSDTQFPPSMLGLALPTMTTVKFISQHDNEFGYSNRVVDLRVHMASKE